jgi:hypothetical protein
MFANCQGRLQLTELAQRLDQQAKEFELQESGAGMKALAG